MISDDMAALLQKCSFLSSVLFKSPIREKAKRLGFIRVYRSVLHKNGRQPSYVLTAEGHRALNEWESENRKPLL